MSIVACVKVYDGIALGAEGMSQLVSPSRAPGQPPQFIKAFSNARKLFKVGSSFGVLAYGAGNIGNRSIESFLDDFDARQDLAGQTAERLAGMLLEFMRGPYDAAFGQSPEAQRPQIGFYLAGYSGQHHLGSEWEFVLPRDAQPRQVRPDDQLGASWRGVTVPFARLHSGMDPRLMDMLRSQGVPANVLQQIQTVAARMVSPIVFDGMPLQDAIGFCKFVLDITIGMATYEAGVPTCGGRIQVAVITRRGGFAWVENPTYSLHR
jgi:hypothetical protein